MTDECGPEDDDWSLPQGRISWDARARDVSGTCDEISWYTFEIGCSANNERCNRLLCRLMALYEGSLWKRMRQVGGVVEGFILFRLFESTVP